MRISSFWGVTFNLIIKHKDKIYNREDVTMLRIVELLHLYDDF